MVCRSEEFIIVSKQSSDSLRIKTMLSKKRQAKREQDALEQRAAFEAAKNDGIPEDESSYAVWYGHYLDNKDAAINCMLLEEGAKPSEVYEALLDSDWCWGQTDFGYAEMRLDFYTMKDPKKRITHRCSVPLNKNARKPQCILACLTTRA